MRYGRVVLLVATVAILLVASGSQHTALAVPPPMFGDGSDGPRTYVSSTTDVPIDSAASGLFGTTALTATNPLFAAGQRILIHQTRGNGAGAWEINEIATYSAGLITTVNPLANNYFNDPNPAAPDKAQVLTIPQYTALTINAGVTVSAKAWNGLVGGIVAFAVNGTALLNGEINATGAGYRSDPPTGLNSNGRAGEGSAGPVVVQVSANGNGGGGALGSSEAAGGGGGGNGTVGQPGNLANVNSSTPGAGGGTAGSADLAQVTFGGAGGTAGTNGQDQDSKHGGHGGGLVFIFANSLQVGASGVVNSNGNNGDGAHTSNQGGHGGGTGGGILVRTATSNIDLTHVHANGGIGGAKQDVGGRGGDGGLGRIRMESGASVMSSAQIDPPVDSPASGSIGSTSLTATNLSFEPGQDILIHQTRGVGAGAWETNSIAAYSPGMITTAVPLSHSYEIGRAHV